MEEPFYASGLRFSCARCSSCCTGEPGHVFLSSSDLRRLSAVFGLPEQAFFERYCRLIDLGDCHAVSLTERSDNACEFWGDEGCTVYEARPVQCSTYPFWSTILASKESWNDEAGNCPGMREGQLHSGHAIEEALYARRAVGIIRIGRPDTKLSRKLDINRYLGQ
ncbi:MAG: YkgJ family cysteine cluster protein [Spirochaetota bacterium]